VVKKAQWWLELTTANQCGQNPALTCPSPTHTQVIGLLDVFTPTEGYDDFGDV
jgi:hypothetical protein